ncbi:MAG: hypothetical protein K2W99_05745 [Chthoniobacterales bacterium]|nr:hypothetical protein [Chthoniobacterales bacterium]
MRIFYKLFLFLLFVLVLATCGINLYLQRSGIKEQLSARIQASSGMSCQLGSVVFLPWRGLALEKVVLEDVKNKRTIEAASFSVGMPTLLRFLRNSSDWNGAIRISNVALNKRPLFTDFYGALVRKGTAFNMTPFSARLLKGKLTGSLLVPNIEEGAYQLNLQFVGIPLKECLMGTTLENKIVSGSVQGTVTLSEVPGNPNLQKGSGTLELVSTQVQSAGFLSTFSALLPLEEFQVLKLQEAKATYKITPTRIVIDSLKLHSQNLILKAVGALSFDGFWNLDVRLLLNPQLQQRLQSLVPITLVAAEPGYQAIPFSISGSTMHIQSDFLNKIMMQQATKEVEGVLQNVINNAGKNVPNIPVNLPNIPIPLPFPIHR